MNQKAFTLVEVIVALAIISIVSIGIFSTSMLTLKMLKDGKTIYDNNNQSITKLEKGEGTASNGSVSFKLGTKTITVAGQYRSQRYAISDRTISFVEFRPS